MHGRAREHGRHVVYCLLNNFVNGDDPIKEFMSSKIAVTSRRIDGLRTTTTSQAAPFVWGVTEWERTMDGGFNWWNGEPMTKI